MISFKLHTLILKRKADWLLILLGISLRIQPRFQYPG